MIFRQIQTLSRQFQTNFRQISDKFQTLSRQFQTNFRQLSDKFQTISDNVHTNPDNFQTNSDNLKTNPDTFRQIQTVFRQSQTIFRQIQAIFGQLQTIFRQIPRQFFISQLIQQTARPNKYIYIIGNTIPDTRQCLTKPNNRGFQKNFRQYQTHSLIPRQYQRSRQ